SSTGRPRAICPPTPKIHATDTYHGVAVDDPYRWLERGDDPDVRAWTSAQNAHTRAHLDAWPGREALRARIAELTISGPVTYAGPGRRGACSLAPQAAAAARAADPCRHGPWGRSVARARPPRPHGPRCRGTDLDRLVRAVPRRQGDRRLALARRDGTGRRA